MENWNVNLVVLSGKVLNEPVLSHTTHQEQFYLFELECQRLSGVSDRVKVLCSQALLSQACMAVGEGLTVRGALRSYNNKSGVGSRLLISVLAHALETGETVYENSVTLHGTLCKTPVFRKTPLGREICDLLLAVNRRYGRADYFPCIVWGVSARETAGFAVGTRLALEGRVQSRLYHKNIDGALVEKTAYEVSVASVQCVEEADEHA